MLKIYKAIWSSDDYTDSWKVAEVSLIPKEGKRTENQSSYRPICLLTTWGNVYDKIVIQRLTSYFENNSLLNDNKYGFRKGKSTIDALTVVKYTIMKNNRDNYINCVISLDMNNTLNTIRSRHILETID